MPPPPRRAAAAMRARAPSPLPPIPQPPPSVDLGVELPVVARDAMDDDFPETGDLEVELPTVRPAPQSTSLGQLPTEIEATFLAHGAPQDSIRRRGDDVTFHADDELLDDQEPYERGRRGEQREDDADVHADEAPQHPFRQGEDDATFHADDDAHDREDDEDSALAEDEALAERLSDRLRGNPRDRATVLALADVLDRLGRDLELFALLSARMDEGDADERRALAPARRAVLARLAERARNAGNSSEAELYEMMLAGGE